MICTYSLAHSGALVKVKGRGVQCTVLYTVKETAGRQEISWEEEEEEEEDWK